MFFTEPSAVCCSKKIVLPINYCIFTSRSDWTFSSGVAWATDVLHSASGTELLLLWWSEQTNTNGDHRHTLSSFVNTENIRIRRLTRLSGSKSTSVLTHGWCQTLQRVFVLKATGGADVLVHRPSSVRPWDSYSFPYLDTKRHVWRHFRQISNNLNA